MNSREDFDTKLMGLLTPMPHEIILEFQKRYKKSPKEATDWYYSYSRKLNYVRAGRIAKNLHWTYSTAYGILEIAVNCVESEGPEIIATTKKQKSFTYPKCQLCPENAGFVGTAKYPARQTLRPIPRVRIDLYQNTMGKITIYEGKKDQTHSKDVYQLRMYWDGLVYDGIKPDCGVLVASTHPKTVSDLIAIVNTMKDTNGNNYNFELKTWRDLGLNYSSEKQ